MLFKSNALSALAVVVTTALISASPATAQIPAGTVALQNWFAGVIPRIFPNTTDNWHSIFEDGTLDPNIKLTFNANSFTNRTQVRAFWAAINAPIVQHLEWYNLEPTGIVAFSKDAEGHSGWVIATAKTTMKSKAGQVYTGGGASAYVDVEWDAAKQQRVVKEWKEVNTPPNYPGFPWS